MDCRLAWRRQARDRGTCSPARAVRRLGFSVNLEGLDRDRRQGNESTRLDRLRCLEGEPGGCLHDGLADGQLAGVEVDVLPRRSGFFMHPRTWSDLHSHRRQWAVPAAAGPDRRSYPYPVRHSRVPQRQHLDHRDPRRERGGLRSHHSLPRCSKSPSAGGMTCSSSTPRTTRSTPTRPPCGRHRAGHPADQRGRHRRAGGADDRLQYLTTSLGGY